MTSALVEEQLAGLATISPARLRAEWRRLHRGRALPEGMTTTQLARATAWRLQEKVFGGIPHDRLRELDRLAAQLDAGGNIDIGPPRTLKPGTRLVRKWRNKVYCVTVLDDGFEWNGERYQSLTQIAKDITGASWSGPRFFGLNRPIGEPA